MRSGAHRRTVYAELFPGHHRRVLDYCRQPGRQWHLLPEIEQGTGNHPAAGAVMALRERGELRVRVGQHGRPEIAAQGDLKC